MKRLQIKQTIIVFLMIGATFFCGTASAQFPVLLGGGEAGEGEKSGELEFEADVGDIDLKANIITLTGNVNVDDKDMNIKCDKMIIYMGGEEDEKKETDEPKKEEDTSSDITLGGGSKVYKTECIGNVIITRKEEGVKPENRQRATAGKATYLTKQNIIILEEKPVVSEGASVMRGERMEMNTKTGKVKVFIIKGGGSTLETKETSSERRDINE